MTQAEPQEAIATTACAGRPDAAGIEAYFEEAAYRAISTRSGTATGSMVCREADIAAAAGLPGLHASATRRFWSCATRPATLRAFHNTCRHRGSQLCAARAKAG